MKVWVVGSGTFLPHPDRGSPGHWIECGGSRILLDCGAGTLRTLAALGRDWGGITHLLLSHFHTDHVGEVAALLFALKHGTGGSRSAPLTVLGPSGLDRHLDALREAHGEFVLDPGFPVEVVEADPASPWVSTEGDFRIRAYPTLHTDSSLAFRVESIPPEEGVVGFTGDTGPDPDLGRFMRGCQVLIAECSLPETQGIPIHLTPNSLAELAALAAPDLLVAVHVYPPLRPEEIPDLVKGRGYRGRVLEGRDGLAIRVEKRGVEVTVSDQ